MYPKLIVNDTIQGNPPIEQSLMDFVENVTEILKKPIGRKDNSKLKIHDLTRGKYSAIFDPKNHKDYTPKVGEISKLSSEFQKSTKIRIDVLKKLKSIPVFLVESSMGDEYIAVPRYQCAVRVPTTEELYDKKLGVYIYSDEDDVIPRRIFIWMDRIQKYANDEENPCILFEAVLYHEMAHALMDVRLYGFQEIFSYSKSDVYKFFEEAYADSIALKTINFKGLEGPDKTILKRSSNPYGQEVNEFDRIQIETIIDIWMKVKIHFDDVIEKELKELKNEWEKAKAKEDNSQH